MAFLTANWSNILLVLVAVDALLIGIFPTNPIFGTIGGILKSLGIVGGGQPPTPAP